MFLAQWFDYECVGVILLIALGMTHCDTVCWTHGTPQQPPSKLPLSCCGQCMTRAGAEEQAVIRDFLGPLRDPTMLWRVWSTDDPRSSGLLRLLKKNWFRTMYLLFQSRHASFPPNIMMNHSWSLNNTSLLESPRLYTLIGFEFVRLPGRSIDEINGLTSSCWWTIKATKQQHTNSSWRLFSVSNLGRSK